MEPIPKKSIKIIILSVIGVLAIKFILLYVYPCFEIDINCINYPPNPYKFFISWIYGITSGQDIKAVIETCFFVSMGTIFTKNFLFKWNYLIGLLFLPISTLYYQWKFSVDISSYLISNLVVVAILIIGLYTIVSVVSSEFFKGFDKIRNIQDYFSKERKAYGLIILIIIHAINQFLF